MRKLGYTYQSGPRRMLSPLVELRCAMADRHFDTVRSLDRGRLLVCSGTMFERGSSRIPEHHPKSLVSAQQDYSRMEGNLQRLSDQEQPANRPESTER